MGQYHGLYNLDKREMVFPHELGYGAKQWEHTGFRGSLSDVLYALTAFRVRRGGGDFDDDGGLFKGRWHGDRVAVIGDYAEFGDLPEAWNAAFREYEYNGETRMVLSEEFFTDIGDEIREAVRALFDEDGKNDWRSLRAKNAEKIAEYLAARAASNA